MTPMEATALCRFTKALCPAQAIDEMTPDAWHLALADLRFEDAKVAVVEAAKLSPFVAPAEIREQVRRMRRERILAFGVLPDPPAGLSDAEETRWLAETKRAIADGREVERPELPAPGDRPDIDFTKVLPSVDEVI